jgi:hypothetical protein
MVKLPKYPRPLSAFSEAAARAAMLSLPSPEQIQAAAREIAAIAKACDKLAKGLITDARVIHNAKLDAPLRLATREELRRYDDYVDELRREHGLADQAEGPGERWVVEGALYDVAYAPIYIKTIRVELTPAEYETIRGHAWPWAEKETIA